MKIKNLSDKEISMLDKMWSIEDLDSLREWQSELSVDDLVMSKSLYELLILESLDEYSYSPTFDTREVEFLLKNIFQ